MSNVVVTSISISNKRIVSTICPVCNCDLSYNKGNKKYECYSCGEKFIMCENELVSDYDYDVDIGNKEYDILTKMTKKKYFNENLIEGFRMWNDEDI